MTYSVQVFPPVTSSAVMPADVGSDATEAWRLRSRDYLSSLYSPWTTMATGPCCPDTFVFYIYTFISIELFIYILIYCTCAKGVHFALDNNDLLGHVALTRFLYTKAHCRPSLDQRQGWRFSRRSAHSIVFLATNTRRSRAPTAGQITRWPTLWFPRPHPLGK